MVSSPQYIAACDSLHKQLRISHPHPGGWYSRTNVDKNASINLSAIGYRSRHLFQVMALSISKHQWLHTGEKP